MGPMLHEQVIESGLVLGQHGPPSSCPGPVWSPGGCLPAHPLCLVTHSPGLPVLFLIFPLLPTQRFHSVIAQLFIAIAPLGGRGGRKGSMSENAF